MVAVNKGMHRPNNLLTLTLAIPIKSGKTQVTHSASEEYVSLSSVGEEWRMGPLFMRETLTQYDASDPDQHYTFKFQQLRGQLVEIIYR